tara:strand:- start:3462 stop:5147 length:1686 start_codon:yes stop_codon:yes gene_type:complete
MKTLKNSNPRSFIHQIIEHNHKSESQKNLIVTRFPPEPNGYLHIGHAKSICLNFGIAKEFNGKCFLRFDDTNPDKENAEYVHAIKNDVEWLGFNFSDHLTYASDYFEQLYQWALDLIQDNNAYVCSLSGEQIRETRGTLKKVGIESPYRNRSIEENIELFHRMRAGDFDDGMHVLRAKIDMSSPNINLRDPTLYRIRHQHHQNTGNSWCIYPMYDFTHPLSDAIEGVTHSLCTLEFEDHRPLYDWILQNVNVPCQPRQIEFSRLSLDYTIMSKRHLTNLVQSGYVNGWDDPRMPTLSGMRRRGYSASSIRNFCERIGVTKKNQHIELSALETCVRDDLETNAPRKFGVLNPIKLIIENYPESRSESFEVPNHPNNPSMGTRTITFSREIWIDSDDFLEDPPKNFFRLAPGREVRLRYAYYVTCTNFIKDPEGHINEIYCQYDPDSHGGGTKDGRKVKGTLHWVSCNHAVDAKIRLYNPLFLVADPLNESTSTLDKTLNPDSLTELNGSKVEISLSNLTAGKVFQLERIGYFCIDTDTKDNQLILNRTVTLRESKQISNKKL